MCSCLRGSLCVFDKVFVYASGLDNRTNKQKEVAKYIGTNKPFFPDVRAIFRHRL